MPSPYSTGFALLTFSELVSTLATRMMSQQPTSGAGMAIEPWTRQGWWEVELECGLLASTRIGAGGQLGLGGCISLHVDGPELVR